MFLRGRNYFKFLYGETSASNQDAKTGTRFALLPKMMATTKCTKYIKQQFSKKLNIRQRRKLIQRWEAANLVSFTIVPVYKLKSYRPQNGRAGNPGGQSSLPELGRWSWESGEPQSAQVCRADYQRRALYRKRTLKICKWSPSCL